MDELIAFLRARLDDDQRDAPSVHDQDACDNAIARGHDACTCGWPDRLLAEVDAKRRILDEWAGKWWVVGDIAKMLALPYAGHPDYREGWRL